MSEHDLLDSSFSRGELCEQITALTAELESAKRAYATRSEQYDVARADLAAMREERDKARTSAETTRKQFEDLKERLYNAETENARMRGYLTRVHESDIARDGMVEIDDVHGKRSVPKWTRPDVVLHSKTNEYAVEMDAYGRQRRMTHWTSY